jgi:hypothetical protein
MSKVEQVPTWRRNEFETIWLVPEYFLFYTIDLILLRGQTLDQPRTAGNSDSETELGTFQQQPAGFQTLHREESVSPPSYSEPPPYDGTKSKHRDSKDDPFGDTDEVGGRVSYGDARV